MNATETVPAVKAAPKSAPRSKPEVTRVICLLVSLCDQGKNGVVRITETTHLRKGPRVKVDDYFLSKVPSDFGEAFLIEKILDNSKADQEESRYHVLFQNEQDHTCECKGFTRWGKCRHVSGLLALRAKVKI
jgi:hypothetical protein